MILKVVEKGLTATHFELWLGFGLWLVWSWSIATPVLSSHHLQFRKRNQPWNLTKTWQKVKMLTSFFDLIQFLHNRCWYIYLNFSY